MEYNEFKELEQISQAQFDYLVSAGVIKRTRKFKKPRTMRVDETTGKVLYFDRFFNKVNFCGYFEKGEESE